MRYYKTYIEAKKLNLMGKHSEALEIYRKIYNAQPENDLINYGIGYTLMALYPDIYNYPEIEIQIRNHLKKAQLIGIRELGFLEEKLFNIEEARKYYKKAAKFDDLYSYHNLIFLELKLGNIDVARNYYDIYLEKVRNGYKNNKNISRFIYMQNLVLFGISAINFNDNKIAKKVFTYLEDIDEYREEALNNLMKIEIKEDNYQEAYKKYLKLCDLGMKVDSYESLYILSKLNKLSADYPTEYDYYKKQLLEYNVGSAIEHCNKHSKEFFLDINDIFKICSNAIREIEPTNSDGIIDRYILKFGTMIGTTLNNQSTNRIIVKTMPKTKNILTMYPAITEHKKIIPNFSDSEIIESSNKTKRKSQIEKFNSKYNL